MGGPGLHAAVRSDAGPRAHSVARLSQLLLLALLCKGLASSCFGPGFYIGGIALCVPLVEEQGLVMD